MRYWLGFDIGGTKIATYLVNESDETKWEMTCSTANGEALFPAVAMK